MKTLEKCLVCGSNKLTKILSLGTQPLSGVFPTKTDPDPVSSPLELMFCDNIVNEEPCSTIQLGHLANFNEMYGANYGYNSSLSPLMKNHLNFIADKILSTTNLNSESFVLDIGCNDGTLLSNFMGVTTNLVGVDPSADKFKDLIPKQVKLFTEFFPSKLLTQFIGIRKFQVITSIAMFYDLEKPIEFIKEVFSLLTPDGVWVVELAEMNSFLKNLSFDQICHEHLLYIDEYKMVKLAESCGFYLEDITYSEINGGSACYYFKKSSQIKKNNLSTVSKNQLIQLSRRIKNNQNQVLEFLEILKQNNSVIYGYGASTKGNVYANFLNLDRTRIPFVSDINNFKHGRVTPGTKIPIISHEQMRADKPDYLLVFIWHLRKEVIANELDYLKKGGKLIFPLPRLHIVTIENFQIYLNNPIHDESFDIVVPELTI